MQGSVNKKERTVVDCIERQLIENGEQPSVSDFEILVGIADKRNCLPRSALYVGIILQYGIGQKLDVETALKYFKIAKDYEMSKGMKATNPFTILRRKF